MQLSRKSPRLTKDDILQKIGSEAIYRAEISDMKIGRAMSNPMRKDQNPSFSVFIGEDGNLHHIDYADDRYKGGCIELVMQKYGLQWKEAVEQIGRQWGLLEGIQIHKIPEVAEKRSLEATRRHCMIQVQTRPWDSRDTKYWGQYGITREIMVQERCWPISELYINRQREKLDKDEIAYVYQYDQGMKIYMPQRTKEDKWKSNISTKLIEDIDQLNGHKKVIVSKSKKDKLVLRSLLPQDVMVISTQNESVSSYTEDVVQLLADRQVWISYDSDPPGKQASIRVTSRWGYKHVNVPDTLYINDGLKDWAEVYAKYGPDLIIDHMKVKGIII